jgi:hypothetical protein
MKKIYFNFKRGFLMKLFVVGVFLFTLFTSQLSFGQKVVAINCGGPEFTAADGTLFTADQYNVSGGTFTQGNADDIVGTVDDLLYKSERNGNFGYAIPVPAAGDYKVTLLFAEVWFGSAGSRVFNVSIEGQELLSNFDIVAVAGKNVALKKEFELEITDGVINIAATTVKSDGAKISAIIVEKAVAPDNAPPVTPLGNWSYGTTKAKEIGNKRLLVVTVTGETAVMNNISDISLTYGGQVMTKQVSDQNGTTAFGNFSYIFTLNEAGIAAADASGTIVPTWTTVAPTSGFDIFSAFFANVDQTTPVSATSKINLNGSTATSPAVAAGSGDLVLMSVAFAGQPRTPTYPTNFIEILKNPEAKSWGSGIIASKEGDGTEVIPSITNSNSERVALTAIVLKKGKNLIKTPPVLVDTWTAGTTKPKAVGTKRVLVVAVTGETAVMNDVTDLSLTYGGQAMNKIVSTSEGTTGFGNVSYIFTLNEAGIATADETGTIVPTWTTKAPTGGVDFFSAFYGKVDQSTPVSDTSFVHLNGTLVTAPAVTTEAGDLVLMSVAFAGQPRTPTYETGFTEILKNPNSQSWGSGIIAFKEADGTEVIPSITNSNSERAALTAIVLKQGEEEGLPPVYYKLTVNPPTGGKVKIDPMRTKYEKGTRVKLMATPDFGFYFVNWTDSIKGVVTDTTSIVMNSDKVVTANFVEKTKYTITTEVSNGNIFLSPTGGTYYEGVVVTVLAKENVGYKFTGWSGALSGSVNPQTIVVDENKTVIANIEEVPAYTVSINATNGRVSYNPRKDTYALGDAVILVATPNEGYRFKGWGGDLTGKQNPTSMVMNSDKFLVAVFELIPPSYTLSIGASSNGSVSLYPAGGIYEVGTMVVIKATPNERYKFIAWSGDKSSSFKLDTITMNGNKSITPLFDLNTGMNLNTISEQAMLAQNYPNPFSTITTIPYQLNEASNVKLTVFNLLGEKVKILVNEHRSAGLHEVVWDASDYRGKQVSEGIYFFNLEIGNNPAKTKKGILIR